MITKFLGLIKNKLNSLKACKNYCHNPNVTVFEGELINLSKEEQIEKAKVFSEGSESLQNLLLFLWKHNIKTRACCAGHEKTNIKNFDGLTPTNNPYIVFEISSFSENALTSLLSYVLTKGTVQSVDVENNNNPQIYLNKVVNIQLKHGKDFDFITKSVANILKDENKYAKLYNKLDDKQKDFIENCVNVYNLDLKNNPPVENIFEKKYVVNYISVFHILENGLTLYSILNNTETKLCNDSNQKLVALSNAYYFEDEDGFYIIENDQIKQITFEEIKKRNLHSKEEFERELEVEENRIKQKLTHKNNYEFN